MHQMGAMMPLEMVRVLSWRRQILEFIWCLPTLLLSPLWKPCWCDFRICLMWQAIMLNEFFVVGMLRSHQHSTALSAFFLFSCLGKLENRFVSRLIIFKFHPPFVMITTWFISSIGFALVILRNGVQTRFTDFLYFDRTNFNFFTRSSPGNVKLPSDARESLFLRLHQSKNCYACFSALPFLPHF